jgi:methionyl-tRNA formyltransferase
VLERRVRALNPWPGTETVLDGAPFKIRAAALADGGGDPGQVLDDRLTVACGEGALRLLRVQAPGRAAMAGEVFLRGRPVPAGTRLG